MNGSKQQTKHINKFSWHNWPTIQDLQSATNFDKCSKWSAMTLAINHCGGRIAAISMAWLLNGDGGRSDQNMVICDVQTSNYDDKIDCPGYKWKACCF